MRASLTASILTSVLLAASYVGVVAQHHTKYGVTVTEVKRHALAKVRTYTWTVSHPSLDKTADKQIIAAVDRELTTLGLRKLATGRGDAEVTYASVIRTDVDLKSKPSTSGALRTYPVGILVVQVRDSTTRQMLFSGSVDSPIDTEPARLEAAINAAATALFKKYPVPDAKR